MLQQRHQRLTQHSRLLLHSRWRAQSATITYTTAIATWVWRGHKCNDLQPGAGQLPQDQLRLAGYESSAVHSQGLLLG